MWRTLGIAGAIAILLMLWPMPAMDRFLRYGMDLLHAPFFAILAFVLDQKRKRHQAERGKIVLWLFLLLLGLSLEIVQVWVGRNSSWQDGLANLLGIVAGMFFSVGWDTSALLGKWQKYILAFLLIAAASASGIRGLWDTLEAQRTFPRLADFESSAELERWKTVEAHLSQSKEHATGGVFSGKLALHPGRYPGASLELPAKDWSAYTVLAFDVMWNPDGTSLHNAQSQGPNMPLHIKLEDQKRNDTFEDRFETTITLSPGKNAVRIPLLEIRNGPVNRTLQLDALAVLSLFMTDLEAEKTLFLDQFRLE